MNIDATVLERRFQTAGVDVPARRRDALRTLCAGLLLSVAAWGQGLSTINGSVADPSGAMIPAAKITVVEVETSLPREAIANSEGYFVISSLRPTRYRMIVEASGFRTFNQTGITLRADDSVTFNVKWSWD